MGGLPLSQSGRPPLEVAREAAQRAGELLQSHFYQKKEIKFKGRGNLVTEVDLLSERLILDVLRSEFPSWGVLAEESKAVVTESPYTWVVDPLDGTNNYAFGIPIFNVSIAALEQGQPVLGVTYEPLRQECFWAERGKGAWLNGKALSVSQRPTLRLSLVGFDMGYDDDRGAEMLDFARRLWPGVHSLRVMGSGALGLAYTAAGRLDLYLHRSLYPWDVSAGVLMVQEAGGIVTDWGGHPLTLDCRELIAANPAVHREVMGRLVSPRP